MKHIFIINPIAGVMDKTEQIRKAISERDDIEAIFFNTEEAGHEKELMKEMLEIFDDEKVRIYICGGSGTLSNAIDAFDISDMDHVEVGFYPCGLTNDFLKNFGNHGKDFENIYNIVDGNVRTVDFMRCIADGDEENPRNELLFVTVGLAANIEKISKRLKTIGGISPAFMYVLGSFLSLPISPSVDYELLIDGEDYSQEYRMIYVGNSPCIGGRFVPIKEEISCVDGYLNVLLLKKIPPFKFFRYLMEFMHGNLPIKHQEDVRVLKCKSVYIRRKDGKPMNINADGEISQENNWAIKIVNNRMKLIVPECVDFAPNTDEIVKCLGLC